MYFYVFPLASPVHIVGGSHPQVAQPSKVLSLFPRPSGNEGLVPSHMGSLAGANYPTATKSGMNPFPLLILIHGLMFLCLKLSLSVFDMFQMSVDRCLYL